MLRRTFFLVVLVYVSLDLSTPDIPGAFVFDADGSVESTDAARLRLMPRPVVLAALPKNSFIPLREAQSDVPHRLRPRGEGVPSGHVVVNCLPRAACSALPLSEDSH